MKKPNKNIPAENPFPEKPKSEFFECECSSHALGVMSYGGEEETYLSIWQRGSAGNALGFIDKLRHCWKILRTGTPYGDEVVFSLFTLKRLADHLTQIQKKKYGK